MNEIAPQNRAAEFTLERAKHYAVALWFAFEYCRTYQNSNNNHNATAWCSLLMSKPTLGYGQGYRSARTA